jgi:hypothetical protein
MTNETTQNFWQALADLKPIELPEPSYRLYYNDQGRPLFYTTQELIGNYIELDVETWSRSAFNVQVIDGKLITIVPPVIVTKLVPSTDGVSCHPQDVCIVVNDNCLHQKWSLTINEIN